MCKVSKCNTLGIFNTYSTLTCCRNLRNKFQCECATGYEGAMCEIDRDECASNPCLREGVCKDLPNGFECRCLTGFAGNKFQALLSIYV